MLRLAVVVYVQYIQVCTWPQRAEDHAILPSYLSAISPHTSYITSLSVSYLPIPYYHLFLCRGQDPDSC